MRATQFVLRFEEKGGKARSIPVLYEYLAVTGLKEERQGGPFLRTTVDKWRTEEIGYVRLGP